MKIQLTISLLVSDRMETLGRCLASLKPLLRELDSELIVVYTGKDPDTLALAKRYTSHIIPFTWCNDFSKARNAGLIWTGKERLIRMPMWGACAVCFPRLALFTRFMRT